MATVRRAAKQAKHQLCIHFFVISRFVENVLNIRRQVLLLNLEPVRRILLLEKLIVVARLDDFFLFVRPGNDNGTFWALKAIFENFEHLQLLEVEGDAAKRCGIT